MPLLIFYLLLAIVVSFLCSILEAVILSITPSYIESLSEKRPNLSRDLRELKENVDEPLAAILSLNTIAHTVGAAGVGAQAALVFTDVSMGVVSGVLTLLILVFSEIIPKTLGASYWRQLAFFSAKALKVLVILLKPFVWLAGLITRLLSKGDQGMNVSRAELSAMADIGHQEGVFEESEMRIIKNLIAFQEIYVSDIMTPRTVVVAVRDDMNVTEVYDDKQTLRFSRIPVYQQERDNVIGYILKHDVLEYLAKDKHGAPVKDLTRKMLLISASLPIPRAFEKLMEQREQIALAVDQYGGMAGVVTMEDIMETLLGVEIVDEFDSRHDMQAYARERWRQRAKQLGLLPDGPVLEKGTDQYISPEGIQKENPDK